MCHHPVLLGIILTCVVFLLLIALVTTDYFFSRKTTSSTTTDAKKGLPADGIPPVQPDPDPVVNDTKQYQVS